MPKVFSNNPLFVDLFYGVVVGSAVALLSWNDHWNLLLEIVWIVAVLEDWYLYYRHVVDIDAQRVAYSFRSLMIEFLILLSWFLGFQALKEQGQQGWFLLCLSAFYLLKVAAGVTFYLKHGQLLSRRMLYDAFWLLMPLTAYALHSRGATLSFWTQYWIAAGVTTAVLCFWWFATTMWPPAKA